MGRRKSKRKPPPKQKNIQPLDQQFNCPFCNHEKSCEVKMYAFEMSYEMCVFFLILVLFLGTKAEILLE